MTYQIERIELYVRETPPGRMAFAIGKQAADAAPKKLTSPLAHVRLTLRGPGGETTWGCSADRLSVRWLDKRPRRSRGLKSRELVDLIYQARDIYLESPKFETPFEKWQACHPRIMQAGRRRNQEDLTSSFASALFERAVLDAAARLERLPLFQMVVGDRLGIRPETVHPELKGLPFTKLLPERPATEFFIRHTVGLADPLTADDLPAQNRVGDGLPETLEEYIAADGLSHFKVKISGNSASDRARLARLWDLIPQTPDTVITLDANEAYRDIRKFRDFVFALERDEPGLFQHIRLIEQPLQRSLKITRKEASILKEIGEHITVIIDESDGTVEAFKKAHGQGFSGTSHKNCKGFYKSLLNHALIAHYGLQGESNILSGEDLQNLPVMPLHQDFVSLSILGLDDCERNGHHYNFGLSMLSEKEKPHVTAQHRDMYVKRGEEWFLRITDGKVRCASLQCGGYGVRHEPDWSSMTDMRTWVRERFPTGF